MFNEIEKNNNFIFPSILRRKKDLFFCLRLSVLRCFDIAMNVVSVVLLHR